MVTSHYRRRSRGHTRDRSQLSLWTSKELSHLRELLSRIVLGKPAYIRRGGLAWDELVKLGIRGELVQLKTRNSPKGQKLERLPVNWPAIRMDLVANVPDGSRVSLFQEAELFGLAGLNWLAWCDHGQHWYLTDSDPRRVDCVDDHKAGQIERYRTTHPAAARRARQVELERRKQRRRNGG